jgi:hypothetical protein
MMKKLKKIILCLIGAGMLTGALFLLLSCSGTGDGEAGLPSYGGTDPKGDYIVVMIDRENSKAMNINYTAGETESSQTWLSYTSVAADSEFARGFSIVNSIDIGGGNTVLFAEYPEAALVYMLLDGGEAVGNPVFLVYRDTADKSSFYARAYNWVKFFIDPLGMGSDMSCGFAAFDTSGDEAGKMYGASYSKKLDFENDEMYPDGLSNINEGGDAGIDALTWNAESNSFCIWNNGVDNWDDAVTVTGTASGALILDWGPDAGGGGALAVPQTSAVDNLSTFWPTVEGTYLTMTYGYTDGVGADTGPVKVVVHSDGSLDVYDYSDRTDTGTSFFEEPLALTRIENVTDGPVTDVAIWESFAIEAGNGVASSPVVQNAHKCQGAFIVQYIVPEESELLIMMAFDPTGRFFGFTMFEWISSEERLAVRFGLGVKDSDYDDTKVPPPEPI